MLLLTHRLGVLGDLSPVPLLWGIALTPSFPPGCSRSLGPYSPSWRAPVSHGKAQPLFPALLQPATSPGAPSGSGVSVPRRASVSPRGTSPAPAHGLSFPLAFSEKGGAWSGGTDGVIRGLPASAWLDTGKGEEQAPCTVLGADFTGPAEEFASQPAEQHMGFNHRPNHWDGEERPESY